MRVLNPNSVPMSVHNTHCIPEREKGGKVAGRPPHRCTPPALQPAEAPEKVKAADGRLSYAKEMQQETFCVSEHVLFPFIYSGFFLHMLETTQTAELIKSHTGGHMGCKNLPHYRKAHSISVTVRNSFASCYWVNRRSVLQ